MQHGIGRTNEAHNLCIRDLGAGSLCMQSFLSDTGLLQSGESLQRELAAAEQDQSGFVADLSQQDYNAIVEGWREKLQRVQTGEQRWGLFLARKPS